uniref:PHB domain-containing protein n=1 Tax=Macrostomum lignano TaxID=282301 RepID=A0A1I8IC02_9PLAT
AKAEKIGCCGWLLAGLSYLVALFTFPVSLLFCLKLCCSISYKFVACCAGSHFCDNVPQVVQEYERAVIFRLGRLISGGAKGPGIILVLPCIESYSKVDLRTVSFDVPPQEVLTKDSVTVSVDAVVYYRVNNATVSVANVENAHHSTRLLAQTTLRNVLGTKNLAEILSERESISNSMQDVRLPVQLQRAMAAEAEADREARA